MTVSGVVKSMTGASANRAALGAGAIVMDIMAIDDGRQDYDKINRLRSLRPDMILLAGGTDGGTIKLVMEMAEVIKASSPKPRFGASFKLPLIFAGNRDALPEIRSSFDEEFNLSIVDNIRPTLGQEVIEPTRREVHELFMEHVMSHAPGYLKLMKWADIDILPTPAGEGMAMQLMAHAYKTNVIGVGLGGATTNVYSIFDGKFVRSVSANLGMSYSICNVLKETGMENILRWIPFDLDETDLENRLYNKMIRPTTIPQTLEDLIIEHAVAREALRLGLLHHKTIATRLKGVKLHRDAGDIFNQALEKTYINMMDFDIIAGTGGLLSHAPRRVQSLLILTDAFQPEGVTRLFQDSVFMMPHLGVLSKVHSAAAWSIFDKDCLVRLGTVIAPVGIADDGEHVMDIKFDMSDGNSISKKIKYGEIMMIHLPDTEETHAVIEPQKDFDIGNGPGNKLETKIEGGTVVIDARGRPLSLPRDKKSRDKKLIEWINALNLYPEEQLKGLRGD